MINETYLRAEKLIKSTTKKLRILDRNKMYIIVLGILMGDSGLAVYSAPSAQVFLSLLQMFLLSLRGPSQHMRMSAQIKKH